MAARRQRGSIRRHDTLGGGAEPPARTLTGLPQHRFPHPGDPGSGERAGKLLHRGPGGRGRTMSPRISPPLQRIAAFALLLAAVGALVFGVIQPLIETYADAKATVVRERIAMERARITGLDTAVLQAELARLKQRQTSATGLVPATNESLAAAQLQDRLKSTLEAAHGELR